MATPANDDASVAVKCIAVKVIAGSALFQLEENKPVSSSKKAL